MMAKRVLWKVLAAVLVATAVGVGLLLAFGGLGERRFGAAGVVTAIAALALSVTVVVHGFLKGDARIGEGGRRYAGAVAVFIAVFGALTAFYKVVVEPDAEAVQVLVTGAGCPDDAAVEVLVGTCSASGVCGRAFNLTLYDHCVPSERVLVTARVAGFPRWSRQRSRASIRSSQLTLDLEARDPAPRIEGRVLWPDGLTCEGTVTVSGCESGSALALLETSADGAFRGPGFPAGCDPASMRFRARCPVHGLDRSRDWNESGGRSPLLLDLTKEEWRTSATLAVGQQDYRGVVLAELRQDTLLPKQFYAGRIAGAEVDVLVLRRRLQGPLVAVLSPEPEATSDALRGGQYLFLSGPARYDLSAVLERHLRGRECELVELRPLVELGERFSADMPRLYSEFLSARLASCADSLYQSRGVRGVSYCRAVQGALRMSALMRQLGRTWDQQDEAVHSNAIC